MIHSVQERTGSDTECLVGPHWLWSRKALQGGDIWEVTSHEPGRL